MSLVLDLPAELETELTAEAARLGLPLPEYILRLLAEGRVAYPAPRTGGNCSLIGKAKVSSARGAKSRTVRRMPARSAN